MSKFQFGKTKVQKTAESIRDDKEQGSTPLVPVIPDANQQQEEQTEEQVEEQKLEESQPQVEERKPTVQEEQMTEEKPEFQEEQVKEEKPETPVQTKAEKPESPVQPREEPQQTQENSEPADTPPVPSKALAAIRDKSTTNGIVVNVPMEDYFQLMMLKKIEKKTLKELALQAIHEFVERNRVM